MKKIAFVMAAMLAFISCDEIGNLTGDKGNDKENGKDENSSIIEDSGLDKGPTKELEPSAQKVKLETVAEALMDEYPASGFEDFFLLADRFSKTYFEDVNDYYWDPFFEYCEEKGEDMFLFSYEEEDNGDLHYTYNMECFLEFSKVKGLLTLGSTSATCEDYDGTKMVFSLGNDDYVVELKASGKEDKAYYSFEDIYGSEQWDGEYDENGYWQDKYVMVHYENNYKIEVMVPEKINMTVTKNGKDFASVVMSFVKKFSQPGLNITTDCFQVTTTVTIDGHSVVIDKSGYDASTGKASVTYALRKGSETIAQAKLSADVKCTLKKESYDDGYSYGTYTYPEFSLAKNFDIYFDVLGQLQVVGKCKDGLLLAEYIENFDDADNDSQCERALGNINNSIELGVYYDKSVTRQAKIVFDYFVERDDYYGDEWYELEPIIEFPDGSKYAFYEYFDEDSFEGVTNSFELWINMYETMLEHYFD